MNLGTAKRLQIPAQAWRTRIPWEADRKWKHNPDEVEQRQNYPKIMKKNSILYFMLLLCSSGCNNAILPQAPLPAAGTMLVYFSPHGGATEAIVQEINGAKRDILVQAYSFTSQPIAKSLLEAKKRGVAVEVVLDKSQRTEKYSAADFTRNAGIPTYIDGTHAIAHNKIMIIDERTILTGSFNFTRAAEERNAENLLVIKDNAVLVKKYIANFKTHKSHSELYEERGTE
jgi:phosphatidylserine/phosphatidylglycerophosphate/cardiolipin synthase-like enzyme